MIDNQPQLHKEKKARDSNIELMRIVAMVLIVGCHISTHGGFSFDTDTITLPQIWWHILKLGGNFGTDVFVMISGYFLVTDKVLPPRKNKVVIIWLQIIFYSVLLFILAFPLGYGDTSLKSLAMSFLPVTFSAWWFASAYFVLYLVHPYINLALIAMDKKQYGGFLILLMIMWSIIPLFTTSSFQSNDFLELFLMYTIAGYIRRFGLFEKITSRKWTALWLFFTLISLLSSGVLLILGKKYPIAATHSTYFYSQTSILTILRAVSFFMMFLRMNIGQHKFINLVSSATFGVYLLHDSKLLRRVLWMDVFKVSSFQDSVKLIPYSLFIMLVVFSSCVIIDLLRQFLLEKQFKKLLARITTG